MNIAKRYFGLMISAFFTLVIIGSAHTGWATTLQISAGTSHTAILRSDGTIWAAGSNASGQLGDGSGASRRTSPVQVGLPGNAANWKAIAAGADHTLGLKADGSLWAWGSNQYGQLGNGKNADQRSPVLIGSSDTWTAIAAGGSSSYALKSDGTLWAWGRNNLGQLGNDDQSPTPADSNVPVQVFNSGSSPFVAIAAGDEHAMALQADGSLWAWGANKYGTVPLQGFDQDNKITHQQADSLAHATPVQIDLDNDWSIIAAGGSHSLAIKANGTLWSWGRCNAGQLGIGVTDNAAPTAHEVPVQVGTDRDWASISAGSLHTLATKRNGALWAWGGNSNGQLGDGTITGRNSPTLIADPEEIADITVIAAGGVHAFAARANGEIYSWGANASGQLGDGTTTGNLIPLLVDTDAVSWIDTDPGGQFTLARRSDGTLWAWGDNTSGQLGDGSFAKRSVPAMVGTAVNWVSQASGWNHTLALKADGTLWAWGDNTSGQLGDGKTGSSSIPVQIGAAQDWSAVAAGDMHSLALKRDGTLWAWGDNTNGQLGDGTTTNALIPEQVVTNIPGNFDSHWVAISAGSSHTLALQSDGTLWVWGDNSSGQLGDATLGTGVNTPRQIVYFNIPGFNSGWTAISAGMFHSLALQADGTLWAWGSNISGQLGNGNTTDQNAPVQVQNQGAAPFVAMGAGDSYSLGRLADGSLWSWGSNTSGQLGIGLASSSARPVREVTNANDWFSAGSGGSHTIALKAGGTLWAWGSNDKGQLGDGTMVARNSPASLKEARIDVSPETMTYSTVAIGSESSQSITIENKGTASLTVSALNFSGPDSNLFSVKAGGTCSAAPTITIAPAGSCTVIVAFKAALPGGTKNATLTIASNDPNKSAESVDLSAMARIQHTVTASIYTGSPAGSGMITPPGTVLVLDDTNQTFAITPNVGYHVVDVKVDGVSKGAVTAVTLPLVKADAKVEASFAINAYIVTTTTVNGSIAGAAKVNHGSTAIYTITPASGYHIADVKVDGVSQGAVTTLTLPAITANKVITAIFAVNTLPPVTTATPGSGTYTDSVAVTLTANVAGSTIYYTTDGTPVTTASPVYSAPIRLAVTTTTPFTVQFMAVDQSGNAEPVKNATYLIYLGCDLNGDGKVDIADALKALQISIGLSSATPDEMIRGDVGPLVNGKPNPNGVIDVADALVILQRGIGLVSPW